VLGGRPRSVCPPSLSSSPNLAKGKCLSSFVRIDLVGSWSVNKESHRVPTSSRGESHDLPARSSMVHDSQRLSVR
jgi:hypothetical protein